MSKLEKKEKKEQLEQEEQRKVKARLFEIFTIVIQNMTLPDLHIAQEKISEIIKLKSKKLKGLWTDKRKLIGKHFYHVRKDPKDNKFRIANRNKMQFVPIPYEKEDAISNAVPKELLEILKPVSGPSKGNLYIAYFPNKGFSSEKKTPKYEGKDIVYVGEVRLDKTGIDYRPIFERWGYGGGDHGGQAREIVQKKRSTKNAKTKIDPYFAEYEFNENNIAFLFYTKEDEPKRERGVKKKKKKKKVTAELLLIRKVIEISLKTKKFTVVNKESKV